jgi:hypothetical protein
MQFPMYRHTVSMRRRVRLERTWLHSATFSATPVRSTSSSSVQCGCFCVSRRLTLLREFGSIA